MKVAVIGATGYSGVELIRWIEQHPYLTLTSIISGSQEGVQLEEVYPHLTGMLALRLEALQVEKLANQIDVVFFATPSGVSREILPQLMDLGVRCIDLSGDFRLPQEEYKEWYKHEPPATRYLEQASYGLSEIYAEQIKKAKYVANPGCYPTATLLGLLPLVKAGWIDPQSLIIDGKSGVSGAGRKAALATQYVEVNENVKAYKLGTHQHIPEIEQVLSDAANERVRITFSTHLVPMTRGIMCTMYANLTIQKTTREIIQLYEEFYQDHPFVRIRPEGTWPTTKEVYGSNYCDLGFMADPRTGRVTVVSVIDNVVKGAAGQAIQNVNLMNAWDVRTGLLLTPVYP